MKQSKILSIGLASLAAVALATPNVGAHNPGKYTGVPFIVPGYCTNYGPDPGVYSSWVNVNRSLQVKVVANGEGDSGFEMYCSNPANNVGPAYPNLPGTFPQGTLTFSETGLPSGGNVFGYWEFSDGTINQTLVNIAPVNGIVSMPTTPAGGTVAGATVEYLQVYIETNVNPNIGSYTTVYCSNFRYNGVAVLNDTTFTDTSTVGVGFCS